MRFADFCRVRLVRLLASFMRLFHVMSRYVMLYYFGFYFDMDIMFGDIMYNGL